MYLDAFRGAAPPLLCASKSAGHASNRERMMMADLRRIVLRALLSSKEQRSRVTIILGDSNYMDGVVISLLCSARIFLSKTDPQ